MNAMDITRDDLVAALTPAPTLEEQLERAERDEPQHIENAAAALGDNLATKGIL